MTPMKPWLLLLVILLIPAGCYVGPSLQKVERDMGPAGTETRLVINSHRLTGELIALRDDSLILLTGSALTYVPFTSIRSGRFDWPVAAARAWPSAEQRGVRSAPPAGPLSSGRR